MVTENIANAIDIYGEKIYRLDFQAQQPGDMHAKGITKPLRNLLNQPENVSKLYSENKTVILQPQFRRHPEGGVFLVVDSKHLQNGVQPKKRCFVDSHNSVTFE